MAKQISQGHHTDVSARPSANTAVSESLLYKLLPLELRRKIYGFVLQKPANPNADRKIFDDGIVPICLPRCPDVFGDERFGNPRGQMVGFCQGCFRGFLYQSGVTVHRNDGHGVSVALLRVSRLVQNEAGPLLYQLNSFSMQSSHHRTIRPLVEKNAPDISYWPLPYKIGFDRRNLRFLRHLTIFNKDGFGWWFNKVVIDNISTLEELQVLRLVSARRETRPSIGTYVENAGKDLLIFGAHVVAYHPSLSNLYYVKAEDYDLTDVWQFQTRITHWSYTLNHREVDNRNCSVLQSGGYIFPQRYTDTEPSPLGDTVEWCLVDVVQTFHYVILTRKHHAELVRNSLLVSYRVRKLISTFSTGRKDLCRWYHHHRRRPS